MFKNKTKNSANIGRGKSINRQRNEERKKHRGSLIKDRTPVRVTATSNIFRLTTTPTQTHQINGYKWWTTPRRGRRSSITIRLIARYLKTFYTGASFVQFNVQLALSTRFTFRYWNTYLFILLYLCTLYTFRFPSPLFTPNSKGNNIFSIECTYLSCDTFARSQPHLFPLQHSPLLFILIGCTMYTF